MSESASSTSRSTSSNSAQAARVLENARRRKANYSSHAIRDKITSELAKRGLGFAPYRWQLDVAEALLLGVDCSVIAGTGAGKTLPFIMPLLIEDGKMIIIISPLNALEEDQASRFNDLGFRAVAVNGETYTHEVHSALEKKEYNVIITSPEMCLKHDRFRHLLSSINFAQNICALVIDEAHCIAQWGSDFRREYAELGTLRAFLPMAVPCLVTSATMPPHVLTQVHAVMHMQPDTSYQINLGTDRPNIAWFARTMAGAKSDLESLSFLIPTDENPSLTPTMVFFDDINTSIAACQWLKERLPPHLQDQVDFYNSNRSPNSKRIVLRKFQQNKIKILFTTEAAGMGCDIPHVEQVVQFMVPSSLAIWMQRAGRAGRSHSIDARAILLVQPSVFQEVKKSQKAIAKSPPNPNERNFRKNIEAGLRTWIETKECRREAASKYFGDNQLRSVPTAICCDNCLLKENTPHSLLSAPPPQPRASDSPGTLGDTPTEAAVPVNMDIDVVTDNVVPSRPPTPASGAEDPTIPARTGATRRDGHLQGALALLVSWRQRTWHTLYVQRPWGQKSLLPDVVVTALATKTRYTTLSVSDAVSDLGWNRLHGLRHGQELLNLLSAYDQQHYDKIEHDKLERAEKKKQETLERKQAKQAADKAARERAKASRTPRPRPSRAKPKTAAPHPPPPTTPLAPALRHPNIHYHTPVSFTIPHTPYTIHNKENVVISAPLQTPSILTQHLRDPPFLVPSH